MFYIGIDFGGTNLRVVACDGDSQDTSDIVKAAIVRKKTAAEEIEENLLPLINQFIQKKEQEGKELGGIGVAMAALFDRKTGIITNWPNNLKYQDFPMKKYLEEYYKVPVLLEDDANAAALGEQLAGEGIGFSDLVYVTVSTGIGSGIIVNDRLITGCHGWAGELGHIRVTDEAVLCTCGAKGCLQAVASGPAIFKEIQMTRFYKEYVRKSEPTLEEYVLYAKQGNQELNKVFHKAGNYIGKALANVVMLLDVPVIILGGGVTAAGDALLKPIQDAVNHSLQSKRIANIVCSKLNDKNGVLGALCLVEKMCNKNNKTAGERIDDGK